ncbi:MAG: thermonuclease family protein [Deltaproteobacteria bacterium]|nr:thermonuclease family protein [Deltaproteobacteria bacterium]MBN2671044.1 thermonuclease family protein [Deltaproteobacteria bacterium]
MNRTPLNPYETVFDEVCQIYEATILRAAAKETQRKTDAYFQMGKRITQLLTANTQGSPYGKQLVQRLCKDLKQRYNDAPSPRTLLYMRKFAKWYRPEQIHPGLSWSHYCVLLSIDDKKRRHEMEQRAVNEHLSRNQLQKLASLTVEPGDAPKRFPLIPRQGRFHISKLVFSDTADAPALDIGFGVEITPARSVVNKLKKMSPGILLQRTPGGRLQPVACAPGERYCYQGNPVHIIDGDTVKMRLQLTPTIAIVEKLRLRGVDAMEVDTPEGQKAKRALTRLLKNQTDITVYTYSHDRFGRYIADLVTSDGAYINKQLVEKGHARFFKM